MTGLTSAVLLVIVMLIVYGAFKRSTRVEDAERFILKAMAPGATGSGEREG